MADAVDIDPFLLPSVALPDRFMLPAQKGIYFALTDRREVIYIGKAKCLVSRWKKHHRLADLESIGNIYIAWITYNNIVDTELFRLEQEYIIHFHPHLNGTNLPLHLRTVSQKKQREERYKQNTVPWKTN